MRCTSSDLIIAAAVLGRSERIVPSLVRDGRVPKGQETVKIETLDRLHRAPRLQAPRKRAQAERVQGGEHGRMQEGPITEPFAQPIIAYRRLRIDVLLLCQPGERRPLIADFVDELEREALPAG